MPVKDNQKKHRETVILFSLSLLFLLLFLFKTPTNGDTYVYARSITTFEGPLIHRGYYIIGYIFHAFLQKFGSTPLQTLGYISVFFGSLSVACMYLFSFELTGNRLQSCLSAFILLFSGTFWFFSSHGEVYVPQLAFVLLAVLFVINKKPFFSGLSILVGISITPTSCLAIPALIYLINLKQFERRQIASFILPVLLAFLFVA